MSNIAYAKVGLSLRFETIDVGSKGNFFSGSDDWVRLLVNLAYNNPDDNFFIIGSSDFSKIKSSMRCKLFPNNNVFDTVGKRSVSMDDRPYAPIKYLNKHNINLDYGIIPLGPVLNRTIPNLTITKKGTIAKILDRAINFQAPVWNTLNETGIKWISLADDPRCLNLSYDLYNLPYKCVAQVNSVLNCKNIKSYDNLNEIETTIPVEYSNIEMSNCLDQRVYQIDDKWKHRKNKVCVVLNEASYDEGLTTTKLSNGHRPRYPILKEWLLNNFEDINVYGSWSEEIIKSSHAFKGKINRHQLYPEMMNWKHSLCVPIDKGWATAKYLEYLKCGVSPFMHPEYDDQKNTNVQDFYRVSSVEEFKDKVAMSDDTHIEEINKGIKNCLSDEYISGQRINDDIYSALDIERNIKNKVRDLWTPQKYNTLENFME